MSCFERIEGFEWEAKNSIISKDEFGIKNIEDVRKRSNVIITNEDRSTICFVVKSKKSDCWLAVEYCADYLDAMRIQFIESKIFKKMVAISTVAKGENEDE